MGNGAARALHVHEAVTSLIGPGCTLNESQSMDFGFVVQVYTRAPAVALNSLSLARSTIAAVLPCIFKPAVVDYSNVLTLAG